MLLCLEVRETIREDLKDSLEHLPSPKYTVYTPLYNSIEQKRTDRVFEVILVQGHQGFLVSVEL